MERSDVMSAVRELGAEVLSVEPAQITEEARFGDDLEADSLDLTELVMALEDRFDIEVPEDALENVKTVGDVIDIVVARTS